jgi:hypothetical protein
MDWFTNVHILTNAFKKYKIKSRWNRGRLKTFNKLVVVRDRPQNRK